MPYLRSQIEFLVKNGDYQRDEVNKEMEIIPVFPYKRKCKEEQRYFPDHGK
jgi:hypothetical protein